MANLYYRVSLRKPVRLREIFLVQLVCEEHQALNFHESSREIAACKIAVDALKNRSSSEIIAAAVTASNPTYLHDVLTRLPSMTIVRVMTSSQKPGQQPEETLRLEQPEHCKCRNPNLRRSRPLRVNV
jgi:hypothetical protein